MDFIGALLKKGMISNFYFIEIAYVTWASTYSALKSENMKTTLILMGFQISFYFEITRYELNNLEKHFFGQFWNNLKLFLPIIIIVIPLGDT